MTTRREFLKQTAATGVLAATSGLAMPAIAQGAPVKLGYVSPQTGPLAAFGEADKFVIDSFLATTRKMGLNYEVVIKDSQSNPNRAAEVAKELIVTDKVNLMLVSSTPETTNPVSTTCEAEEMPCISTVAPWQPWFIGQQANPGDPGSWKPFNFAYHFFWGLEDITAVFTGMWAQVETSKQVGGLFPNDGDGNAWGDKVVGFPPVLEKLGYTLTDPGRFQNLSDDFSAQINAFKQANAEIVTGVVIPPDLATFWNQAKQQSFKPKVASIGKALLFPQTVESLGEAGHNLSTEVWWTPTHPFKSSLSGETTAQVANAFTKATGRPWTQPIGFAHALFELAVDVMKRAGDPTDGEAVAKTIGETRLDTLVGPIAWGSSNLPPFAAKNIAKTPLVGGQWRLRNGGGYDLVVVENGLATNVPLGGRMEAIT